MDAQKVRPFVDVFNSGKRCEHSQLPLAGNSSTYIITFFIYFHFVIYVCFWSECIMRVHSHLVASEYNKRFLTDIILYGNNRKTKMPIKSMCNCIWGIEYIPFTCMYTRNISCTVSNAFVFAVDIFNLLVENLTFFWQFLINLN